MTVNVALNFLVEKTYRNFRLKVKCTLVHFKKKTTR